MSNYNYTLVAVNATSTLNSAPGAIQNEIVSPAANLKSTIYGTFQDTRGQISQFSATVDTSILTSFFATATQYDTYRCAKTVLT
ncbi:hypothetical protein HDU91_005991, partial [Kappamyces sp. JEL0680]